MIGRKIISDKNGTMTLETSITFSAVFFCVVVIVYICLILYHQSYLESLSVKVSQRAAATWCNLSKDMFIEKVTLKGTSNAKLYCRLFDTEEDSKKIKIYKYIAYNNGPNKILKNSNCEVSVEIKNYILYRKLKICISESYDLPIGGILDRFGLGNIFKLSASSETIINEPTETINNIDFIVETGKEVDRKYLNGKMGEFADNYSEKIEQIIDKIKGFFS